MYNRVVNYGRAGLLVAGAALGTPIAAEAGTQFVTNGDFEQVSFPSGVTPNNYELGYNGVEPVVGWTTTGQYNLLFLAGQYQQQATSQYSENGQYLYPNVTPDPKAAGGNLIALDGAASYSSPFQQTVTGLTPGAQYTLTFDWAAAQLADRSGATQEAVQVSLGGQTDTTATVNNPSGGFSGWMSQAYSFTATSATEVLSFLSVGQPNGLPPVALLDNVSLTAAPEPAAIGLIGIGVLGLAIAGRRRRA